MISTARLQQNFSDAAAQYDRHATLQQRWRAQVLQEAIKHFPDTATLLDIGCGTGAFTGQAKSARPHWDITGLDIAPGMVALAKAHGSAIQADAQSLPLTDASLDGVVSSLCLQWVEDAPRALAEITRVLKPGCKAVIMTLAQETLRELRALAPSLRLLSMRDEKEYEFMAAQAGLKVIKSESQIETHAYPDVRELLHSFRAIGAQAAFEARPEFLAPARYAELSREYIVQYGDGQGGIVASWQPLLLVLEKP